MQNHLEFGKRTYVMGILNITPDSFSGDGLMSSSMPASMLSILAAKVLGRVLIQ
jgi:dihydropteroate synthase